jgi:nucleoside-diphosphate-sugar epimerase
MYTGRYIAEALHQQGHLVILYRPEHRQARRRPRIQQLPGHSTIKTTQIYAKVVEQKVSQDMGELRKKIAGTAGQQKKIINLPL